MKSVTIVRVVVSVTVLVAPAIAAATYDPEHCRSVAGSLDIHWEAIAGPSVPCAGIEYTDGTVEDAADGSISMMGVSVSDGCLATAAYSFTLSKDGRTLTGSDTANDVTIVLTREPEEGCFHGHASFGADEFVAEMAADVFASAAEPICGDVNDTGSVNTSDALLVLRKGVGQDVDLGCSRYGNFLGDCEFKLSSCEATPVCGDGLVDDAEDCDVGDLNDQTCQSQGFAGGTLACGAGCAFDTSNCYASRFDASGPTIIDHQTGLEWEKKTTATFSGRNYADPHDVDNDYTWSSADPAADGTAFSDFLAKLNGVADANCYLGHCDWRLPTLSELLGIAVECGSPPCVVDPVFLPTRPSDYWTSTCGIVISPFVGVQIVFFQSGGNTVATKTNPRFVRAVRGGS